MTEDNVNRIQKVKTRNFFLLPPVEYDYLELTFLHVYNGIER